MQIEIKIDDSCIEPRVIIITEKVGDEVNDILKATPHKKMFRKLPIYDIIKA